jgi:hypothetical protein
MLYRVLIGFLPMILIGLVVTGAIPIGNVVPTSEYRSSAVGAGAEEAPKPGQLGPVRNAKEAAAEKIGQIYGVRPDMESLMEEELRGVEKKIEQMEADRRLEETSPGWKPKPGWGR